MRVSRLLLPIAAALAAAATGSAAPPASTAYVWAQPGTAPVANAFADAPTWIVTTPACPTLEELPLLTTYRWAQPGCSTVGVPSAQPVLR